MKRCYAYERSHTELTVLYLLVAVEIKQIFFVSYIII